MKNLTLVGLTIGFIPISMLSTTFKITLTDNFLNYDGKYKFIMDVEGKAIDKTFDLIVEDHKATIKKAKGVKGKNISIKGNAISVKSGLLKSRQANDLEIIATQGSFAPGSATMGLKKDSKEFVVNVGEGLAVQFKSTPPKSHNPKYQLICGNNLPDGLYALKLIIPAAKDITYNFEVKNHNIVQVTGNKTGHSENGKLIIDAHSMCAKRRTKISAAIIGVVLPVIVGTAITAGTTLYASSVAGSEAAKDAAFAAVQGAAYAGEQGVEMIPDVVATASITAAQKLAIETGIAAGAGVAGAGTGSAISGLKGGSIGAAFGFREATAQITYKEGSYQGDKAVNIDYEECRNNTFVLDSVKEKIIITGK